MKIFFGTDGWRSRMDEDFNEENVKLVAKAIAQYIYNSGFKRGIFIGYDGRYRSHFFAKICAEILSSFEIPSFLSPRPIPTPIAAFSVLKYSLDGAIMITASHNPPIYNGIKFIPHYGGPATINITKAIEDLIEKTSNIKEGKIKNELIFTLNPIDDYIDHVIRLISINKLNTKIVVDPMHGATSGIIEAILNRLSTKIHVIRGNIDPEFGGCSPDPIPKNLEYLRKEVINKGFDIGLAFDGDGDRIAAITNEGLFLLANQILPLLYIHLHDKRRMIGNAARTVATSHLLDFVVKERGFNIIETPVGFKNIAPLLIDKKILIGGEESGGISFINHIPEKDGLATALLLLEASEFENLQFMLNSLYNKYGKFEFKRVDLHFQRTPNIKLDIDESFEIINKKIVNIVKIDGLKIVLNDGSWLLIRKSGTENVIRIYSEARTLNDVELLINFAKSNLIL
ncbi:MAG: hypothetical protein QXW62_00890 [Candidatus Methanomethylicaceae archaeon]|nr:phosphoglucomutase/phosphomannomutase family protein [Candidatus Verstraetearchaeota archaeon]